MIAYAATGLFEIFGIAFLMAFALGCRADAYKDFTPEPDSYGVGASGALMVRFFDLFWVFLQE